MKNNKLLKDNIVNIKYPADLKFIAESMGKQTISYSQFTMYANCPHSWKLKYIDKIRPEDSSIHLIFGTSMHHVIQTYLTEMYNKTIKIADSLDLNKMLLAKLKEEYKNELDKNGNKHFCTEYDLAEFYKDGVEILDFLKKKRAVYFSRKGVDLVGIEVPLIIETDSNENVLLDGFLDIILYDVTTDKYKIVDIKTSTHGWSKYQKGDDTKTAQLLLYKKYFAKQYNIPIDKIDIEYFIVKRKLYEQADFPQKRIQLFTPANGKVSMNKVEKELTKFVNTAFNADGTYNTNAVFEKSLNTACKFCKYKGTDHCPESK